MTAPSEREDVRNVVSDVFGEGHEFWRSDTEATFQTAAANLLDRGWVESDAADFLATLVGAMREEYGE